MNRDSSKTGNLSSSSVNDRYFNVFFRFGRRFAVVAFGGDAPFDRPNSIVYRNEIFTAANHIRHYFDHIRTGNGSRTADVSHAIKVASDLVFRPGASKTFILLPCSQCNVSDMKVREIHILRITCVNQENILKFAAVCFSVRLFIHSSNADREQHKFAHSDGWRY